MKTFVLGEGLGRVLAPLNAVLPFPQAPNPRISLRFRLERRAGPRVLGGALGSFNIFNPLMLGVA